MTSVLIVGVTQAPQLAVRQALDEFAALGVDVDLALLRDAGSTLAGKPYRHAKVIKPRRGHSGPGAPRRFSPAWAQVVLRNLLLRFVLPRLPIRPRAWLAARFDQDVQRWAGEAEVIVALDRYAVYPVWRLARRHPRARALYGLDAALRQLRPVR